jgi:hypothetical protein
MEAREHKAIAQRKKQFYFHCVAVLNIPLLLVFSILLPNQTAVGCSIIGRVIEGNQQAPVGKALCQGQAITFHLPVVVACVKTRQVVKVKDTKDLERCTQGPTIIRCMASRANCQRVRSETVSSKPILIKPYGVILRPQPIEFTWLRVTGADRYRIVIDGINRPMSKQFTSETRIVLKPPSGTFSIVVQGMQGDNVLASAVTTFDTLSDQVSRRLDQQLAIVDRFSTTPAEKVLLKVSILSDRGLVSDSIKLLESQVGGNVVLIRTLAEMYRDEGELGQALATYEKAKTLAVREGDREELIRAQEGYRLVSSWMNQSGS